MATGTMWGASSWGRRCGAFGAVLAGALALAGCAAGSGAETAAGGSVETNSAAAAFEAAKAADRPRLRRFLEAMPKGGDLHNHLTGAIYAETWLDWAAEDGLCIDPAVPALRDPAQGVACDGVGWVPASRAYEDVDLRRRLIDALSLRHFVARDGWSGLDQFFVTFNRMAAKPHRLGDMLAMVSRRAADQNILYLELMHTIVVGEIVPLVADVTLTGDAGTDYRRLMASPFGAALDDLTDRIVDTVDAAMAKRRALLGCDGGAAEPGCAVTVRLQHQVLRDFSPAGVYAQMILGWRAMAASDHLVAINLVTPENRHVALRDYTRHMDMLDHLYRTEGPRNVALHAGELALGLVRPDDLHFHIREAIELGHARRIGHGVSIAHERDSEALLARMAAEGIAVEINLTSNDVILGVRGDDHPFDLYRAAGVPLTLSTDDEGVSRIDLTHEYVRAVQTFDLSYDDVKRLSRNAIGYAFVDEATRQRLAERLDARFAAFEARFE
ncbi:adenosine deaminase [Rhodothalassium salexigens DSM 2132]|uniref:adenosine deaminase n=1 Tax=Rhodothalassium salexigens DSM 2132 TaxID=1188247 RepID=A0A4R2PRS4_RHOSA|nr:adenosine deaminase [Rhodothalassium salexigens]MBB4210690.1 adenosine deaminase [Rhodothalassium salexigens DSM 2132]MBK1637891.1 hypothetical protein [Rhodothalassium salexigens DSM 2132]TCP37754.1 adenosine deaminase [Rhodothalassium salexigens DSM 2132]